MPQKKHNDLNNHEFVLIKVCIEHHFNPVNIYF